MAPSFWIEPGRGDGPWGDGQSLKDICQYVKNVGQYLKVIGQYLKDIGQYLKDAGQYLKDRPGGGANHRKTQEKQAISDKCPPGSCAHPLVVGTENGAKSMVFEAKSRPGPPFPRKCYDS